jgi:hypothetical protein
LGLLAFACCLQDYVTRFNGVTADYLSPTLTRHALVSSYDNDWLHIN